MSTPPTKKDGGKSPLKAEGCHDCRHWRTEDGESGDCRRYPPVVLYDAEDGAFSLWPMTDGGDVCGEHAGRLQ